MSHKLVNHQDNASSNQHKEESEIQWSMRKHLSLISSFSFDETLSLIRDLVGKTAEINQLSFSRLLSHWKRRFATVLLKENALFIVKFIFSCSFCH